VQGRAKVKELKLNWYDKFFKREVNKETNQIDRLSNRVSN